MLTAILIMTLLRIVLTYELVTTHIWKESGRQGVSIFDKNYVLSAYIGQIYVIGFTTAIKMTIDYVRNLKRTKEIENHNLENELSMLKSQLKPHFFFNTLNNLYSLILEKSDEAPDTVIKLSEFMSYVIYQGNKKKVPLIEEVKYIRNYIDLERLRFGERVEVEFAMSNQMESYKIPPLLLLQFIENAFKHGTYYELEKVWLYFGLEIDDSWLIFKTKNKKKCNKEEVKDNKSQGLGLKNMRRRLGLLFDENYEFVVNEDESNYAITLKIPLE
ncbi:sensor histidine kinase [Aquimarina hainanensis]|uniref:Sensor histidine kinase n=1 Tax=Aquimarina hainanensis TaxID=1578017 RepID=A0ABW5NEY4_9FLAO